MTDGITHSDECWRWHPKCLEARVEDLEQLRAKIKRLERERDEAREERDRLLAER